mmetsp:Transcript_17426/g.25405  ORF Transcript_17426/g.25405 Transcript_17426/m.25405 type:complete len:243 (+) Transcript_17426:68-796(+)|eukprot:CAMPEP_0197242772 /NCGR_PEP_ID=MMETSP1429-20130617/8419_1 /TAXON_ID=49237 /ORGANISM="Chaetoceros  sp., Strain UNC1202" /LENGTH=242 /DNA_ID=CAMNT_0042702863 /DNA_START=45 /DNA_END=773 /DNA_ORIENTATION=+
MGLTLFKKKKKDKNRKDKEDARQEVDTLDLKTEPEPKLEQRSEDVTPLPEEEEYGDVTLIPKPYDSGINGKRLILGSEQGTFLPSDVVGTSTLGLGYHDSRPTHVPTARESAYSGPPRYDWIDVESAAAVKVQSIFRRNQALKQLEKEGMMTAAMRNRIRSRQANGKAFASEDVPTLFRFCGIGLLFGEATGEDNDALHSNKQLEKEKVKAKEESEKRRRKFRMRKKSSDKLEEAIEVVDNV